MRTILFLLVLTYLICVLSGVSIGLTGHLAGILVIAGYVAAHSDEEEEKGGSTGLLSLAVLAISAVITYLILPGPDD